MASHLATTFTEGYTAGVTPMSGRHDLALPQESSRCADFVSADLGDIVQQMAGGQEAALTAFFDACADKAYGLARSIVHLREDAEEVTMQAFTQAWRQADRYRAERGSPMAWLMTIVRSRALDVLRRRKTVESTAFRSCEEPIAEHGSPPDLLTMTQRGSALNEALAQLSQVQRDVLTLAFFRGLTQSEIARHVQLPLGTVKSHSRRALIALRATLDDMEQDNG